MGLILATNHKGKDASYYGKYRIEYDKGSDTTTFYLYLYWDKESADADPSNSLKVKRFTFPHVMTVGACYEQIKLLSDFEGAEDDL